MATLKRVVVLGRGGSGKSTLPARLGQITGLPVVELDSLFWQPGLAATPHDQWAAIQQEIVQRDRWIMDGDLGPYDIVHVRLQAADTVIVLDFPFVRCAWRAIRRSRERADFWRWVYSYRRQSLPLVMDAIATYADGAALHVLRSPRAVSRFLAQLAEIGPCA
jgi:adenylate kinase family enzyme